MKPVNRLARHVFVLSLLLSLGFKPGTAAGAVSSVDEAIAIYGGQAHYTITRDGDPVGTHRLRFERDGTNVDVSVESDIEIKLLGLTVYRFRYVAEERWQDQTLTDVVARTREGRERTEVSLTNTGARATLTGADGDRQSVPRLHYATNHWHRGVLQTDRVFNTLTGAADRVRIEALGTEAFETGAGMVQASRYRYDAAPAVDVWYDTRGRWVGMRFERGGSEIVYRSDE